MAKKVKLELVGLDGNAFCLMGAFQKAARRQGWTPEEIQSVLTECESGDYDHLLQTLMANTESPESVETPLGEELDGGYDYDDYNAQFDDDPNPYHGDYSEE